LEKADIVYTYLWYDLMPILEKKLEKELKSGAIVITNTSHFAFWQPIEIINTWPNIRDSKFEKLFVYKKE
jgi:alanine-alpha-ketoisovalerate/valine-pyruvate aminotransferase